MARVRIEPGGKVLASIILLGALLFLFFKVKGGTGTQTPQRRQPPVAVAQQAPSTTSNQSQTVFSSSSKPQNEVVPSTRLESSTSGNEGTQSRKPSPAYGEYRSGERGIPIRPSANTANAPIKIFFDFNRAAINKNVYCIFDKIEEIVRQQGSRNLKIVVEGNADSIGPSWYNTALSRMRAAHVADSLSKRLGIPLSGIELVANGSNKPVAPNDTRDGRAENRRTEVVLYY